MADVYPSAMTAFLSEIKARVTAGKQKSFKDVMLSVLVFLPYVLAGALGLLCRSVQYAVAAAQVGFEDGRKGKDPAKKE